MRLRSAAPIEISPEAALWIGFYSIEPVLDGARKGRFEGKSSCSIAIARWQIGVYCGGYGEAPSTSVCGTSRPIKLTLRLSAKASRKQWEADIAWAVFEPLICVDYSGCVPAAWSQRPEEAQPLCHH
jgi:hypothetical protein